MLPSNTDSLRGLHQTARYLLAHLHIASEETATHSRRIASMSVRLGRTMGLSTGELITLRYGTILHDIGKLDVPLEILHKPGKLTPTETTIINQHAAHGAEIARYRRMPDAICDAILFHHERYDGAGYPYGLRGDSIPLASRIIAVVDTFDTIVNKRCYREAQALRIARDEIVDCAGTQFDPHVAAQFISLLEVITSSASKRRGGRMVAA